MEKFFRWTWRINGLLFLLGTLLIFGNVGYEYFERITRTSREPQPIVTNIVADPEGKEQWVLGAPTKIDGSDFAYMRLESENASVVPTDGRFNMFGPESDYAPKKAKNILFINREEETAKWLFNDVDQLVLSVREFPGRTYSGYPFEPNPRVNTIAIVYSVIAKDTNGDGIVDDSDNSALAVSAIDGTNYNVVLENAERIISTELLADDTLSILYQEDGRAYSAKYSLNSYESLNEFELPEVGY